MKRILFKSHRQIRHTACIANRRDAHPCPATWEEATRRVHELEQAFHHADRIGFWNHPGKAS